ncbi:MAG: tetratricopeptide repeat protein [Alphaproteobacteria bacterium]
MLRTNNVFIKKDNYKRRISIKIFLLTIYCIFIASCSTNSPSTDYKALNKSLLPSVLQDAVTAEANNQYQMASENYLSLVHYKPESDDFLIGAAKNLRYVGKTQEAIDLISSLRKEPYSTPVLIEYGKLNIANNSIDNALEALLKALESEPENIEVLNALGIAYDVKEDSDKAQDYYNQALKISPSNIDVLNNLSLSLAKSNKLDEAINLLEPLVYSSKSSPQLRQNLAMLKLFKGQTKEAEELMRQDLNEKDFQSNKKLYENLGLYNKKF